MALVEINPAYRDWLHEQGIATAAQLLSLPGIIISGHPARQVLQVTFPLSSSPTARPAEPITCYLKREHRVSWRQRLANALAGFGLVSHSRREAGTLRQLRQAGVCCPEWIAAGEDQGGAFLLLRGVRAVDLVSFLRRSGSRPGRRQLARTIGENLAHFHEAGFAHRDLYAKHVLVDPLDGSVHFLDWQRSRRHLLLDWRRRWRDLAALHATLPDELATPRDRLACLRSYLRAALPVGAPRAFRRRAVRWIERRARQLLRRRQVREQRQTTLPVGTQRLIWLDGEALCVTPEFHAVLDKGGRLRGLPTEAGRGACPTFTGPTPWGLTRSALPVPGAARAVLLRRRAINLRGWLPAALGGRLVSPELRQLALLFRLQRYGIPTPRLLAFGQRRSCLGCVDSFLLIEPPSAVNLAEWLRQDTPDLDERRQVMRKAATLLRRMHDAGCLLAAGRLAIRLEMGRPAAVVLTSLEGLVSRKRISPRAARADALALWQRLAGKAPPRTDAVRFVRAYLDLPKLDRAARRLVGFLLQRRKAA